MKEVKITVKVMKDFKIYIPKSSVKLLEPNEGDLIDVILRKED